MAPALTITVPSASTATPPDGGKPYTQYLVSLQLPLRRHDIHKRYNDFVALHDALIAEVGTAPPAPLPAKSWLRRTVNNAGLTEERRRGLEHYLQAILASEDARWRASRAWRGFLKLSSSTSGGGGGSGGAAKTAAPVKQTAAEPSQWLDVHRDLKSQLQSARSLLKQRESASTAQAQHSISAEAKASLVRAATSIAQLDDGLKAIAAASKGDAAGWGGAQRLGEGELRRRRDLVGAAKKEVEGLECVLKSMATQSARAGSNRGSSSVMMNASAAATSEQKAELWRGSSAAAKPSGRVLGGPLKETEQTRKMDNSGVLQLQKQVMQEQEEDVLSLGQTVAKLKDMGMLINEELTVQNEMLGVIEQDVGRVQSKIDIGRQRIKKIS
jgi:regulator of vacuolar morphogenesis